jgi:predicted thioesterase
MSSYTAKFQVTPQMSAETYGNAGFPVLATPALLGLFERTAIMAIEQRLAAGEGSVGTTANIAHLAATPIGREVVIVATLTDTDGKKRSFDLKAFDGEQLIATCQHQRFIVNVAKFAARLANPSN